MDIQRKKEDTTKATVEDNFEHNRMEINKEAIRQTKQDGIPVIMEEMESNKRKRKIRICMGPYIECPKGKKFREQSIDTVTRWKGYCLGDQELSPAKLKSMEETSKIMKAKQERMRQAKEEKTRLEIRRFKAARLCLGNKLRRFKASRLHLGSNRAISSIASVHREQHSQLSGITQLKGIDVMVQLRDRELQSSVGLGTPLASNMDSVAEKELTKAGEIGNSVPSNSFWKCKNSTAGRELAKTGEIGNPMQVGEDFTHFVSLELANNTTLKKYQEFHMDLC